MNPNTAPSSGQMSGAVGAITQLGLTLAISLAGIWMIVTFARSHDELVEPSMPRPSFAGRPTPDSREFRLIDPMPQPAVLFMVGSAQEGIDLKKALELNAIVRASTRQPALDAWVTVVENEEHAQAVKSAARDVTFHDGGVTAVEVIDLR